LHRLEKLKSQGKLTQETIQREMNKALEQMKAQPAKGGFDKMFWFEDGPRHRTEKLFLIPREGDQLKQQQLQEAIKHLQNLLPNADEEQIRKELLKLLTPKAGKEGKYEIEIVPIINDIKDKKAPKQVENLEQMRKLLEELERLRALEREGVLKARQAEQDAKRAAAEALALLGKAGKDHPAAKPRLGVAVEPLSPALADQLNLPKDTGMLVTEVYPGTPANKVGVKVNDVLLKIDGAWIPANVEDFTRLIASLRSDTPLDVVVLRKGQPQKLGSVQLGDGGPEAKRYKITADIDKAVIERWEKKPLGDKIVVPPGKESDPAKNAMTLSVSRAGNNYTVRYQEGTVSITLAATVKDREGTLNSIQIQSGNHVSKYLNPAQVPEQFRPRVLQMLEMLEAAVLQGEKQ
jgi:hypothetical protein